MEGRADALRLAARREPLQRKSAGRSLRYVVRTLSDAHGFRWRHLDLERLTVPDAIQLVGIDVLRERYRRGLLSGDKHVRSVAVHQLSQLDPYGKESVAAVEKLIANLTNHNSVQWAVAEFDKRAADPPEVRTQYESEERSIRDFIFARQYRALKVVLPMVLVTAVTLLVVTVTVAGARRKRRSAGRNDVAR